MPADVHAVSLVVYGAREATHVSALLQHDGLEVGASEQLVSSRKSGRSGADDDGFLSHVVVYFAARKKKRSEEPLRFFFCLQSSSISDFPAR